MSLVDLRLGDSLAVLPELADASVDALVTDPPAGIGFMGKAWDTFGGVRTNPRAEADRAAASGRGGKSTQPFGYSGHALGSLGRERPAFIAFLTAVLAECYRVLKPGAHAFVWAIPRTSHWTATAIEDAGFEVRDVVVHLFGSGFPKSLDVSKAIDKAAGAEREDVYADRAPVTANQVYGKGLGVGVVERHPATDDAARWAGWGTSLKPAAEHWILARKPLSEPNVAANVLRWGTGALNIDGCRIGTDSTRRDTGSVAIWGEAGRIVGGSDAGRWPANVTLDEDAAAALDEQSGELASGSRAQGVRSGMGFHGATGDGGPGIEGSIGGASRFFHVVSSANEEDSSASRFRYTAKASRSERNEGLAKCACYNQTLWDNEDALASIRAVTASRPRRATTASTRADAFEWPTMSSGNDTSEPSPKDSESTTATAISRTTESATSSLLTPSPTSGSIPGVKSETASGGSLAVDAENSSPSTPDTGTSAAKDGPSTDAAARAISRSSSSPSGSDGRCPNCGELTRSTHPTVKPVALMRYLCRLICPPGGIVLDPFMGSGSTGIAAFREGFGFIGIERDPDYFAVAKARWNNQRPAQVGLL